MPTPDQKKDTKLQRWAAEDELAKDLIEECRVQLMLKFRFLDLALWRMDLESHRESLRYPLATTAKKVYLDSPRVISRYLENFDELIRDYLHSVMHCVFRHPYTEGYPNKDAWWLACDIIVESVIIDMIGGRFPSDRDHERLTAINEIKMLVGMLVPGKMYTLLRDAMQAPEGTMFRGIDSSKLADWRVLFERDDHSPWPSAAGEGGDGESDEDANTKEGEGNDGDRDPTDGEMDLDADQQVEEAMQRPNAPDQQQNQNSSEDDEGTQQEQGGSEPEPNEDGDSDDSTESSESGQDQSIDQSVQEDDEAEDEQGSDDIDEQDLTEREREEKEWSDIAKQIEMNLEMFSKEWGEEASNLVSSLEVANRKKYSYTDFLRSFMSINEAMKLDMDEFDYIYYTYGMDTYGNMPLIEPLEYKDTNQIRDFVLAIDTSESTSGELVQRFIEHTFEILKESENFSREVNVHIIQCDNRIESDIKITDIRQVDKLMEDFYIRGFGGTDFRPVFDYVEGLRLNGELQGIKGLIYFTDGLGRFPEKTPDYETAFVFVSDGDKQLPPVPPWAIKIVIDENSIRRMRPHLASSKKKKKKQSDAEKGA